jgi:CheY-like chemotaxis protein
MKTILLVEDNENDVYLTKMACMRSGIPIWFQVVNDGEAAINYLAGRNGFSDRTLYPMPDLVFLDLNLPKKNGLEVLEWARAQPSLANLPVVMLTGSVEGVDVDRAYKLGVTSYMKKVANMAEFGQGVRVILKYWLEITILPSW